MNESSNQKTVLVCVTDQYRCQRLIKQGRLIADAFDLPMHVVSVQSKEDSTNLNTHALEYLFRESIAHQADMSVYYSSDVANVLHKIAKKNNAEHIVLGASKTATDSPIIINLKKSLPNCLFYILNEDQGAQPIELKNFKPIDPFAYI